MGLERKRDNSSMQETLLPLFPLEVVLLPANILPLHIFEDRYKEMIGEAIQNKTEFGIVQAGEKGILNLGCTASILEVSTQYPDGRLDIVCQGRRRFEILYLDEEKSYLRGSVSFFDDDPDQAFFPQHLANLKRAAHVKKVGPTNGHGFIALGKKDT
jgi:Lon protease-like protein